MWAMTVREKNNSGRRIYECTLKGHGGGDRHMWKTVAGEFTDNKTPSGLYNFVGHFDMIVKILCECVCVGVCRGVCRCMCGIGVCVCV